MQAPFDARFDVAPCLVEISKLIAFQQEQNGELFQQVTNLIYSGRHDSIKWLIIRDRLTAEHPGLCCQLSFDAVDPFREKTKFIAINQLL
jgi:hypothetical protein